MGVAYECIAYLSTNLLPYLSRCVKHLGHIVKCAQKVRVILFLLHILTQKEKL